MTPGGEPSTIQTNRLKMREEELFVRKKKGEKNFLKGTGSAKPPRSLLRTQEGPNPKVKIYMNLALRKPDPVVLG